MCDQNMGLCLRSCLINLKEKSRSYMSSPLLLFDKWRANLLREDLDPCLKDLAQFDFFIAFKFCMRLDSLKRALTIGAVAATRICVVEMS